MLYEHDEGRDCVRRMRESSGGEELDGAKFATAAKEFIPLLRQHIFKENNVLFKMAEQLLSQGDDAEMDDKFTQVEEDRALTGMHQRYAAEVANWEQEIQ
jgi:hemerythrin-like domain-containing protein